MASSRAGQPEIGRPEPDPERSSAEQSSDADTPDDGKQPRKPGNGFGTYEDLVPAIFAVILMLGVPAVAYFLLPPSWLKFIHYVTVSVFSFVAVWVFIETFSAVVYHIYSNREGNKPDVDKYKRSKPADGNLAEAEEGRRSGVPPELSGAETGELSEGPSKKLGSEQDTQQPVQDITYIIPVYLDNEELVIDETLQKYLKLDYKGNVHVVIVYNTKGDDMGPTESKMKSKWDGARLPNISFTVFKNQRADGKADNVNYALNKIKKSSWLRCGYVAIMDADHHPEADHAAVAVATMEKKNLDVIQGACSIRYNNWLSTLIAVEFEGMYNVGHQGRISLFDVGIFGGSNGVWRFPVIDKIRMDPSMLTEDIDSTFRAVLEGYKFGYSSQLQSSEEAPNTERKLRRQRLRWTQGWSQCTWRYTVPVFTDRDLSWRQTIGYTLLLLFRELFVYFTFHTVFLVGAWALDSKKTNTPMSLETLLLAFTASIFAVGPLRIFVSYMLGTGPVRKNKNILAFICFALVQLLWLVYMNFLQVMGHCRILLGMNTWVATKRSPCGPKDARSDVNKDASQRTVDTAAQSQSSDDEEPRDDDAGMVATPIAFDPAAAKAKAKETDQEETDDAAQDVLEITNLDADASRAGPASTAPGSEQTTQPWWRPYFRNE